MTCERNTLTRYREFYKTQKVSVGDGRTLDALGIGEVHVNMQFKGSQPKRCVIYQVLYVPDLACNLFSVGVAASKGNDVKFGCTRCWIRDSKGSLYGTGSLIDKLYKLDCEQGTTVDSMLHWCQRILTWTSGIKEWDTYVNSTW